MASDTAVIGGSAAGLFLAHRLAQRGRRVTVYEGCDRISPASRTLVVTDRMRDVLGPIGDDAIVNRIHKYELFADGRVASFTLDRPDLIIERSVLITALAEHARRAGVALVFGQRFQGLEARNGGLDLTFESRTGRAILAQAHAVVGADGAFSRVADAAKLPRQLTVPLVQAIIDTPEDLAPDTIRVWFAPEDTPYFYWVIPESKDRTVVGLIGEDGEKTRLSLIRFLERHRYVAREFQGARIPVYSGWNPVHRRLGSGDVYLVGDAAGHVKVTTVGGIVTGFRGALAVADAMLGGSTSRLRSLRRELHLHLLIRKALHHFSRDDYSRLLDLLTPPARDLLGVCTRDAADVMLLRLFFKQPRLLLVGLRALRSNGSFPPARRGLAACADQRSV